MPWLRAASLAAVLAAVLAFGARASPGYRFGDMFIPECRVPAAADTARTGTAGGCAPRTMLQVCGVPEGTAVHADGSLTTPAGENIACADPCAPGEYLLRCSGEAALADVPTPDPTLGCRILPIAASNALSFCCACRP